MERSSLFLSIVCDRDKAGRFRRKDARYGVYFSSGGYRCFRDGHYVHDRGAAGGDIQYELGHREPGAAVVPSASDITGS